MSFWFRYGFTALFALLGFSANVAAEGGKSGDDLLEAAFLLSFGTLPTDAEKARFGSVDIDSLSHAIDLVEEGYSSDEEAARRSLKNVLWDAYGVVESSKLDVADMSRKTKYIERLEDAIESMSSDVVAYEATIDRAYRLVVRRDAYEEEVQYWKEKGTFSFVALVGCVEDWAKRNQPGLMVTAGEPTISVNSELLTTLRLSPRLAEEVCAVLGVAFPPGNGSRVLSPSAEDVESSGDVFLLLAGSDSSRE